MKIGFVVNDIAAERPVYTTVRLGLTALRAGHEVWFLGVGDFVCTPDDGMAALAVGPPGSRYKSPETFLAAIQGDDGVHERIALDELDALLLRNDPGEDAVERPWAQSAGALFGQLAVRRDVLVLNDPFTLANALNKSYFQQFPRSVRPLTLISRDADEIRSFVKEHGADVVLKPLQGSGGQGVFLVQPDDASNLNQIIEAIRRDGYVVVQEYLPEAENGDIRLFVMNGEPLERDGKIAAFRRVNPSGDIRSNLKAGGKIQRAKLDDRVFSLVERVRPKLIEDGMFLVGLDIVGDKLMEVNVFSPGGLGSAQELEGADFAATVIEALERKVRILAEYGERPPDNLHVATL